MPTPDQARLEVGVTEPTGWSDELSGLEGPDYWQRIVVAELARAVRYERPLTLVLIEIAGMADLHRDWGVEVVRQVLREAGGSLRRMSRTSDHCARIGPTRFGVVLTETDEIAAINFVERVREAAPRSMPRVATSLRFAFGWASPRPGETAENLVRRADLRLQGDVSSPRPTVADDGSDVSAA